MITSKQNGATEQMSIQLEYNRMYFRKEFEIAFIELLDCRQTVKVKFEGDKLSIKMSPTYRYKFQKALLAEQEFRK